MDFHPVAIDTASNILPAVKYILSLDISPNDKKTRIAKVIDLIGSDFYTQMFDANSQVFDSTVIGTTDYSQMTDQIDNLATKLVRQNSLGRVIDLIVREFYDSALGKAQEEAFRNAISLDKHPTLTRTVVGKCCEWCDKKQGTYTYPKGEDFARHDNCDCLFTTSGYNSRNGVLNNYVKHKNTPARQEHLAPTLEKLRQTEPTETTVALSQLLEGQTTMASLGNIQRDGADALGINRKATITLTRSNALHMDNAGHFSGTGFAKTGHDDSNPLTITEINNISKIVQNAKMDDIVPVGEKRGLQRYIVLGDARDRQIVIVERKSKDHIGIVTSYKASEGQYQRYMWEAMKNAQ